MKEMKKVVLSDVISYYQKKIEQKDAFFGLYFEEEDLEHKLSKLQLIYKVLGDVTIQRDYLKVFLYAGHWYGNRGIFRLTEPMIMDIYDIIKKYDDMPVYIVDSLLFHYDKECFEKCQVKQYFDFLVSKYNFSEETCKMCVQYIEDNCKKLREFYLKECDKLEFIKEEYPYYFISSLREIITKQHIEFDEIIKKLPSNDLFKATSESGNEYWTKYNDYSFMIKLLQNKISLDDYKDDDYMISVDRIVQTNEGVVSKKMYTSFTKKEYLTAIKQKQLKLK